MGLLREALLFWPGYLDVTKDSALFPLFAAEGFCNSSYKSKQCSFCNNTHNLPPSSTYPSPVYPVLSLVCFSLFFLCASPFSLLCFRFFPYVLFPFACFRIPLSRIFCASPCVLFSSLPVCFSLLPRVLLPSFWLLLPFACFFIPLPRMPIFLLFCVHAF